MKGIVFTEFLEMVEAQMGLAMVDQIILEANLPNDGAYTSVGTYDHAELVRLFAALKEATAKPLPELMRLFGQHLFQQFSVNYPVFFATDENVFSFLSKIDNVIHVEVRKLYPDAELPRFSYEQPASDQMFLTYSSPRGFGDLAEGLILGCIAHFKESIRMVRTDLPPNNGNHQIRFHLIQQSK